MRNVAIAAAALLSFVVMDHGAFTWTGTGGPATRIVGHWTSPHEVVGSIGNQTAGTWEFRAHLQ